MVVGEQFCAASVWREVEQRLIPDPAIAVRGGAVGTGRQT